MKINMKERNGVASGIYIYIYIFIYVSVFLP